MNILQEICQKKQIHIEQQKKLLPEQELIKLASGCIINSDQKFIKSLSSRASKQQNAIIAEIKKASPSKGILRTDFNPSEIAKIYEDAGAACISVLTDEPYFMGADLYLKQVRAATNLPLLRKDFMLDPYQIYESKYLGADCVLLIMAALSDETADTLETLAHKLGMDVLIEVHNVSELNRALKLKSKLIGINNRDLTTLKIDLNTSIDLKKLIPDTYHVVCESGISTRENIQKMQQAGIYSFLIGEFFMQKPDIKSAFLEL